MRNNSTFDPSVPVILAPTRSILRAIHSELTALVSAELSGERTAIRSEKPRKKELFAFADFYHSSAFSFVGPVFGAPAAVLVAESLANRGVSKFVLISACGLLSTDGNTARIGDIVFPRGAIREDGASQLYGVDSKIEDPGSTFQEQLEAHVESSPLSQSIFLGPVWTTDAPLQETPEKVKTFYDKGAFAVDMEYSALLQLSLRYPVELASIFVVSDVVSGRFQKKGFSSRAFKKSLALVAGETLRFVSTTKNPRQAESPELGAAA